MRSLEPRKQADMPQFTEQELYYARKAYEAARSKYPVELDTTWEDLTPHEVRLCVLLANAARDVPEYRDPVEDLRSHLNGPSIPGPGSVLGTYLTLGQVRTLYNLGARAPVRK